MVLQQSNFRNTLVQFTSTEILDKENTWLSLGPLHAGTVIAFGKGQRVGMGQRDRHREPFSVHVFSAWYGSFLPIKTEPRSDSNFPIH